jgi:hypothetical protein
VRPERTGSSASRRPVPVLNTGGLFLYGSGARVRRVYARIGSRLPSPRSRAGRQLLEAPAPTTGTMARRTGPPPLPSEKATPSSRHLTCRGQVPGLAVKYLLWNMTRSCFAASRQMREIARRPSAHLIPRPSARRRGTRRLALAVRCAGTLYQVES